MSATQGEKVLESWQSLLAILEKKHRIDLDGQSLNIAALVAVSRYEPQPSCPVLVCG
jgi:hypothetical protein